ncbi:IS1634 family transposase [Mahella australiensis]|uniref:Transposase IS4 family protein n=1 Tax=Mahella australiensis (strain DSM 15567 / CIP 107919 / 50-1 BON) TaxID=697281 RepID=F3ZXK3_MAHA5|nr:IS1634 family transposase [Mahella australiensis]AEE97684.1 transposase IS4 family protein [Mahella australiensis 50-1 BON]
MKLYYDRKSKDPTYFIQMGFRNGKKTSTRNVKRIGKHSELLAISPDPLAYAKQEVRKYNEAYKSNKAELNIKIDFDEKLSATNYVASKSTLLNIGYFVLQKIYQDLKISDFFKDVQMDSKATFSCNDINRFLTFARILDPKSKWGTFDKLDTYFEQPSFEYQHILRFMDILEDNYDSYLEHLYLNSENIMPRNTSVCYFDCTNYYFETEQEDDDFVDEVTGEILRGFRKYGPSKQHQPSPLVQMGLFMDGNGIPISMCINPGSDNEQKSAIPLERKITKMFKGKPFIYCADAGLGSLNIREYNSFGGRTFVVTQSVKKLSETLQQAVFNDFGYHRLSDDSLVTIHHMKEFDRFNKDNLSLYNDVAYKVIDVDSAVDVGLYEERVFKNGNTKKVKSKAILKQRIIVTFSRKMMEYQRSIRNAQIERAKDIIEHKAVEDVKKGPHDVTRFITRISVGKNGEKASDYYKLDHAAIEREERYDGYYAVATNLEDSAKSILEINSRRCKIEDCFRVLKTNFRARPIYHRNQSRIIAHFMICYTALLIYRLLENKLDQYSKHYTTENILTTLQNMNVADMNGMYYMATYTKSEVCTALNSIYGMRLDNKTHAPKDLNKIIKKITK